MSDLFNRVAQIRRPGLLMRAVRFGLSDYHRARWLKRHSAGETAPEVVLPRLLEVEEHLEETRRRGDANYSISDHVEVLVAMMAELRLLRSRPLS